MRMPKKKQKEPLVEHVDKVQKQIAKLGDDVGQLLGKVKKKYSTLDPQARKKVAAGIAGLGLILAATAHHKHAKKKKKRTRSAE